MKNHLSYLVGAASLFLGGCLYTSHHFNSGRILEPGNTAVTLGYGTFKIREYRCDEGQGYYGYEDSTGARRCLRPDFGGSGQPAMDTADPVLKVAKIPRVSLGYRLGVRGAWGPFTGVELGWHLEAPTNPGTAELDLKLGLPAPGRLRLFHSVSAGWGVGMWADNSFFGEYAASRAFGRGGDKAHALYASYRLTRLATQPEEVFGTDSLAGRFLHNRRWAQQAALGFHGRLPDFPVLPDFVSPQVTVSTPWVPGLDDVPPKESYLLDLNLGFGWRF